MPWPASLADPSVRRADAPERVCDLAAARLADCIAGVPAYHAMRRDSGERLAAIRPFMATHGGNVELVAVKPPDTVEIRLLGSCHGCPASNQTL